MSQPKHDSLNFDEDYDENSSAELRRKTASQETNEASNDVFNEATDDTTSSSSSSSSTLRDLYLKDVNEGDLHGDDPAWRRVHPDPLAINGPEVPPRLRQQRHRHHANAGAAALTPPEAPPAPPPRPTEYDAAGGPHPTPPTHHGAGVVEGAERGVGGGAGGGGGAGVGADVLDGDDQGSRLLERAFVLIGQEMIGHRTKLGNLRDEVKIGELSILSISRNRGVGMLLL